ncbi:hypothetical protein CHLNCDRAFT_57288, partial [Chlorella variabilis]
MASVTLSLILEKIASRDKDFRYMATSDLANELAKDSFRFDSPASEKQVSDVVLTQLEDSSGDISGLAVKCLGYLVNKNRTEQLQEVVAALCSKLLTSNKEQLRDVASLGLKTVVAELSSKKAGTLVAAATPRLIEGLQAQASDVVSSSLDILAELTARYGGVLPDQEGLKRALLPELDESRAGVRKRAIQCLASLAASLPPHSLDDLCATVFARLESRGLKQDTARTYVQAVAGISKSVGNKFGKHLPRAVPLCIRYLRVAAEGDEELREYCLQALESFVLRSPQDEVYPKVAPVLVQRFKEREETVKQDVFQAYVDLLRQVGLAARRSDGAATGLLRADIPAVMRAVSRQLRHKSA